MELLVGVVIGLIGIAYGIYSKREADKQSRGSMLGADEGPSLMVIRSEKGFNCCLHNTSSFPQFDLWVRIHEFAADKIIDTRVMGPAALNDPIVALPDLYPNKAQLSPFYEIDLGTDHRVRVNFFIHARNAQSHAEVLAVRDGDEFKCAYKQWFAEGKEVVKVPDDFPARNREDPQSVFAEDEPTGKLYFKNKDGVLIEIPR